MDELKAVIAKNIVELRKKNNMTQAELAEKLNYSDKAISKWERGESMPDISVLKSVADLFGVKVDYLLKEEHTDSSDVIKFVSRRKKRNRTMITGISILLVWLIATLIFSNGEIIFGGVKNLWFTFVCAVPLSAIVWLIFNSVWFNKRLNFLIISLLLWSTLVTVFLAFMMFNVNVWILFVIGIPSQLIIVLWSGIRTKRKKNKIIG